MQQLRICHTQYPSPMSILGANFTAARCGRFQFTPEILGSQPLSAVDKTGNFGRSWHVRRKELPGLELPTPNVKGCTTSNSPNHPREYVTASVRVFDYHGKRTVECGRNLFYYWEGLPKSCRSLHVHRIFSSSLCTERGMYKHLICNV